MAKRKAAKSSAGRKKTAAGRKTARRARKAARPRKAARTGARRSSRTAKKAARPARKRRAPARSVARKAGRTSTSTSAKARSGRSGSREAGRNTASRAPARTAGSKKAVVPVPASAKAPVGSRRTTEREGGRKAPSLNRERRVVVDDDIVQTPPSSLDLDRTASAVRSGRRNLKERFEEHTETSPALTAGDVDADWESAYSVGDEAPGGDNPTPDQDIVDDIGRAVGIEYQDNEELKGANKVEQRDKKRWELDPASSEDWEDR